MKDRAGGHRGTEEPARWPALVLCIVAGFMTLLDVSIVNVAVPSMTRSLGMSSADVSWVIAGYTLAFGLTLIPAGRLGDMYGRRRMYLIGMSLFTATAVLCGVAPNATILIVGRVLRGVSAGLLAPQAIALLQQMYEGSRRGKAFGYYGATVGTSVAIGPLLGGVILRVFGTADGWRFVFYLSVPVLLAALAFAFPSLPPDLKGGDRRRLDLLGALLLGLGVLAVMLPLVQQTGARAHPQYWLFAVAAGLLALFVLWERRLEARGGQPLVTPSLLRIRSYLVGTMIAATFYAGFTGIFLVLTIFLQQGLRYTALQAALSTLIFTVASSCCAIVSGRVVHRAGRRVVLLGTALATIGLCAVALVVSAWDGADMALVLAAPLLVAGCGCGMVISANQTLTLREITRATAGLAAGFYETGQRIGTGLGTTLASAAFFGSLAGEPTDYPGAAGLGLAIAATLVGSAFVIGLVDTLRSRRAAAIASEARIAA